MINTDLTKSILMSVITLLWLSSAQALDCLLDTNNDGNADTNTDTDSFADSSGNTSRLACGDNASASNVDSIAIGSDVNASGYDAVAVGSDILANGDDSAAYGDHSTSSGKDSISIGTYSTASGDGSIAIGANLYTEDNGGSSPGATASAIDAIAIGNSSKATAAGAIAIGANVVADKINTMTVGVPIQVSRNDGTTQIQVNEKSAGNAVRTLFNVICDTCTPGFRFNQILPSNNTWNFRMLQSGAFSVDDPATTPKEVEFRSGGDLKIGGTLIQASSRRIKKNIVEVNPATVLDKIETLPIYYWTYMHNSDRIRHMGPMSEDFYKMFNLGDTNKGIAVVDSAGVTLAAIKSLNQANKRLKAEKDQQIAELAHQNKVLSERIQAMEKNLNGIDALKQQLAVVLTITSSAQFAELGSD